MQESTEVANLVTRIFDVLTAADLEAVPSLFADEDPVIGIGSDPAEWWEGPKRLIEVIRAQAQEMSGLKVDAGAIAAFEDGALGWAVARPTFRFPDGNGFASRFTLVATKTAHEWRAVHFHLSVGASNEDMVGRALTT